MHVPDVPPPPHRSPERRLLVFGERCVCQISANIPQPVSRVPPRKNAGVPVSIACQGPRAHTKCIMQLLVAPWWLEIEMNYRTVALLAKRGPSCEKKIKILSLKSGSRSCSCVMESEGF